MKNHIILLFLLISPIVTATDYYVAKTGSDSNNGLTTGTPWLTISRAVYASGIAAGSNVYVRAGTYTEKVNVYGIAGTSGNRITIQNYPGESPIIDGTGITCGTGSALVRIFGAYITFTGFHLQDGDQAGVITSGAYTIISYNTIHNFLQNAVIMLQDADYSITEYNTCYDLCMSNSDGIWQSEEYWGTGISAARYPDYCIIRHNLIHDVWGEGYSSYEATNTTIEDNVGYDIYSVGLYVSDSHSNLVQRNFIYATKNMGDGSQVGIGHWNERGVAPYINGNNVFINNIVYGYRRNFYASSGFTLAANNTFVNSVYTDCVYLVGAFTTAAFRNNIVIQEDGLPCITFVEDTDVTFSNNLYNKSYDADAVGTGDVISTTNISKTGTIADTTYYQLFSSSPAISAGTDVNVDYDYLGVARGVTFDIGALEYVVPVIPITPIIIEVTSVYASVTYATIACNVTDDGGAAVTARGVCWSTSANPTTADSKTTNGTGTGAFVATLTPLVANTTYHMRAYATNSAGTHYEDDVTFVTSSTGQRRNVIYIGS